MRKISKLAFALAFVFFASCEKDDLATAETSNTASAANTAKTINYHLAYGDIITICNSKTVRFLTGESNGDAYINKVWNTTVTNQWWMPWARFKIINPNNVTSTADVKTGDEVAFQCLQNNFYMSAESWDDDVNINRTAIGPWEKWTIYEPSNTTVGNTFFYSSGTMAHASLKSVWNKYLRPDASGYAKAGAPFDSTVQVPNNLNSFQLTRQ